MQALRTVAIQIATAVAIGTVFALLGVFNSHRFGWPNVWLYWVGLLLAGTVFAPALVRQVNLEWLPERSVYWRWAASSVLVTIPMTALVMLAQSLVGFPIPAGMTLLVAQYVLLATGIIVAVHYVIEALRQRSALPSPATAMTAASGASALASAPQSAAAGLSPSYSPAPPPRLSRRLPSKLLGAEIWALEAEDHYVRAHTSKGDDLILIRLQDAIDEMDGADGLRTHRSWWVARAGVARTERRTEGGTITLKSGAQAPISRANAGALKGLGWL